MNIQCGLVLALKVLLIDTPIIAGEKPVQPNTSKSRDHAVAVSLLTTPLAGIVDSVCKKSGKQFLIDHRVQPEVVVGQLRSKDVTYSSLLIILRNNDLAAATIGEFVNIVPSGAIRQYPLPVLYEDDDKSHFLDRVVE